MLRVAVIAACPFPSSRGTPVRIMRTCEALCRRGHRVHVVTYHFGDNTALSKHLAVHRIPRIGVGTRNEAGPNAAKLFILDPLLILKLWSVVKDNAIDIIHAHHYEGLIAALILKMFIKRPIIYDAHTTLESELPAYPLPLPRGVTKIMGRLLDRKLPRRADHIIAVSEEIERMLVKSGACQPETVSVIGSGVEADIFMRDNRGANGSRSGLKERIIYAGNTGPFQNIGILIRAFEIVSGLRKHARLVIVSDSPFCALERMLDESPARESVELVGAGFEQLPLHLAGADVAVSPRISCPGVSQKILNYMAAGKPIVAFKGASTPIVHGVTGWVVENMGAEAFARGIIQLLSDRRLSLELGENAKRAALEGYSWEKVAERMEKVYYRVLAGSAGS